ncbi:MAG: hypothetical protein OXC07_02495 [Kistimonas sp.]|nr:hypothetical protein [Kistimonas sp.]
MLSPGELVCTTVETPHMSLWIHGPDSQGQLVQKTCMTVAAPTNGIRAASPDGLSLLLVSCARPPELLQLAPRAAEDRHSQRPEPR